MSDKYAVDICTTYYDTYYVEAANPADAERKALALEGPSGTSFGEPEVAAVWRVGNTVDTTPPDFAPPLDAGTS